MLQDGFTTRPRTPLEAVVLLAVRAGVAERCEHVGTRWRGRSDRTGPRANYWRSNMSNVSSAASVASPITLPQLSGGLHLKGTVIAVRTEEKEWEKEKYRPSKFPTRTGLLHTASP
jgi:hypothetical protein